MIKILHNPQCSKSNCALDYLKEHKIDFELRDYQQDPLTAAELKEICRLLNVSPETLVRKNEELYKEKFATNSFTEEEWLTLLEKHPILLQRPIIVNGNKAVIARPTESISQIIS